MKITATTTAIQIDRFTEPNENPLSNTRTVCESAWVFRVLPFLGLVVGRASTVVASGVLSILSPAHGEIEESSKVETAARQETVANKSILLILEEVCLLPFVKNKQRSWAPGSLETE